MGGGPPCQPFSIGGQAKGFDDDRDLFPYAIKGVRQLTPKLFVFENVKGLLRKSFSTYFRYIILQLTYPLVKKKKNETWSSHYNRLEGLQNKDNYMGLKYNVSFRLMNAADYGVPQKRERVIIVGIRNDIDIQWTFPQKTHSRDSLLWDKFISGDYWERNRIPNKEREPMTPLQIKATEKLRERHGFFTPKLKPWITIREALSDLPDPKSKDNHLPDHQFRGNAKIYPGHNGSYFDEPSKTLKAGVHGVPGGENMIRFCDGSVRYLTIREAKRVQTFPDNYFIHGSWTEGMRQLGNAVPVKLGEVIGASLIKIAASSENQLCLR